MSETYKVVKIQAVDMFPHTVHIENVALLELKENAIYKPSFQKCDKGALFGIHKF